ncbi:MAG: carboxypeptidase-like regulatory domain-containing protein [Verrucomicrobiota bacterium]|nr:carboxypeptidase-like regulatory domain-containing protein [Verrucomicrobiota bacterium]
MKTVASAALLLLTSVVYAGHPAPGVQVIVNRGGATVFKCITDATGQFTTGDLEPGEYRIEVRGVKVVPPVRYFLVLSGARPLGETFTDAGGDLAMRAQVRRPTTIRGQVSANRIIVLAGLNPAANATSPGAATTTSGSLSNPRPAAPTAAAGQMPAVGAGAPVRFGAPPAASTSATSTSRSASRTTTPANASNPSPAGGASARSAQGPLQTTSRATTSAAPAPLTGSRIIGGKRYIWIPSPPGSNLGHWVPETSQPGARDAAKPTGAAAQTTSQAGW